MTTTISGSASADFATPLPVAEGGTGATSAAAARTALGAGQAIQLQTAVATTSGTAFNFTSIPAGVKRINVMFNGVSTNGSSIVMIQLGDAGGIETSGYLSDGWTANTTNTANTSGLVLAGSSGTTFERSGIATLCLISGYLWCYSYTGSAGSAGGAEVAGGKKTTSAELTQLRITTVNGSDVFDAGSVNISWEF